MSCLAVPQSLATMRPGSILPDVGYGQAVLWPSIDFETYSEAGFVWDPDTGRWRGVDPRGTKTGIGAVDTAAYAIHPSTRILCLAYDLLDGAGPRLWKPGDGPPDALLAYVRSGGILSAWNATFEWWIWNTSGIRTHGWPALPFAQLRCAMAKGRAYGIPGALEQAAKVLAVKEQKDPEGSKLLKLLSVPQRPTKSWSYRFRTPGTSPAEFNALYRYCLQDVRAEAAAAEVTPDLLPDEQALWVLDQEVNARGISVDTAGLDACISIVDELTEAGNARAAVLTKGALATVTQRDALLKWLAGRGLALKDLESETVDMVLRRPVLAPDVREVLELRASLAQASVKKLYSMRYRLCPDNRLRDLFAFCGAGVTGRWSGRGPQPQNLTSGGPDVERCGTCGSYHRKGRGCCGEVKPVEWDYQAAEMALQDITAGMPSGEIAEIWGDPIKTISGCLRSLFVAAPGHDLIGADFSAIEAVVLAALAGEEWRLDVFRTHGKIYEQSASKITGIPFEEFARYKAEHGEHHPKRKLGKVAELASGYGAWITGWCEFGALDFMAEDEIKDAILAWRAASPAIAEFWGGQWREEGRRRWKYELHGLEGAAVAAVKTPGTAYRCGAVTYCCRTDSTGREVLYCRLPSGRHLCYHEPFLHREEVAKGPKRGLIEERLSYAQWDSKYKIWSRTRTYGGKLVENVVQATARDLQAAALLRVNAAGYPPVQHVHDEIVAEVPEGQGDAEEFRQTMAVLPAWAATPDGRPWPIRVGTAWRAKRYRKG